MNDEKHSRLDDIAEIIDRDVERMGPAPSISDKLDHLVCFGVHKTILSIRRLGRVVVDEIGEFEKFVRPESGSVDSDK